MKRWLTILLLGASPQSFGGFYNSYIEGEQLSFFDDPQFVGQLSHQSSAALQLEHQYAHNSLSVHSSIFLRGTSTHSQRNHIDVRALSVNYFSDSYSVVIGIEQVYWGATESGHRVNIINQSDYMERPDGEVKLGQALLDFRYFLPNGSLDIYYLPFYREQALPMKEDRFRPPVGSDKKTSFEDFRRTDDIAIRWNSSLGDADIGVLFFDGISRTPSFTLQHQQLAANYYSTTLIGGDIQLAKNDTLYKAEWTSEHIQRIDKHAFTGGLEHTLVGIFDTSSDIGLVAEYNVESNNDTPLGLFQNDLFFGARWSANNMSDTSFLAGGLYDFDQRGIQAWSFEASTRWRNTWRLAADVLIYPGADEQHSLHYFDNDSHARISFRHYF
ncbi:hypothetical protein [Teredinibacter purpureus]|uniref:hypothetical protein n=1 Tax=Teredinibacter purpureus TaxID=2731756 RepID=UPI0005F764BC|nr:hypothetical protein [Teredinibacter purpureus]